MGLFKKRQSRDAPTSNTWVMLASDTEIPAGYTSLDRNENVRLCIKIIAEHVSTMTIHLMKNGKYGDERIKNELSAKIDISPYSMTTRKAFIYRITDEMLSKGNSVVLPRFDADGNIADLIPVSVPMFDNKTLTSYMIRVNNQTFTPDEVLHFITNPSRDYPYIGRGYAPMLRSAVETIAQANATKKAFMKSKWRPSLIITTNSDAEELIDKEKRKEILDSYTETTEEGEPWLIPAGEIDVKKIEPLTLKDLAIQDSLELDIKTVAAVFGIPPFMVGIGSFNKEEYNNFISTTVMQIGMAIQQELTKKLLYSPELYFRFNPKSLYQYDLSELVNYAKETVGVGLINRNEGRNELGHSPVDDPEMNEFYVLENYIPVNKLGDQKKLKGGEKDGTKDG